MAELRPDGSARVGEQITGETRALLVVDDRGICVEASLGARRLLGTGRAEVVGRTVAELLEPGSRERFVRLWPALRAGGGGRDPFALAPPASILEVAITAASEALPDRHLLALEPVGAPGDRDHPGGAAAAVRAETGPPRDPTSRERQVLSLLADGATDGQIAAHLQLSPATVQTYVRNAKAKLGARTRAQAVALAIQVGVIDAG